MRNYTILNIVVEEAKIFQTKERAPLLLCIEVFRPIEMTINEPTKLEKRSSSSASDHFNSTRMYNSMTELSTQQVHRKKNLNRFKFLNRLKKNGGKKLR